MGPGTNTNEEIIQRALKSLEGIETTKLTKAALRSQIAGCGGDHESGCGSSPSASSTPNLIAASSYFVLRTTPGAQPSISSIIKKGRRKKLTSCWASFFFRVIFLSILPGTIPFTKLRLIQLLLLAHGTKHLHMMTIEDAFFKMKRLTAPRDWSS